MENRTFIKAQTIEQIYSRSSSITLSTIIGWCTQSTTYFTTQTCRIVSEGSITSIVPIITWPDTTPILNIIIINTLCTCCLVLTNLTCRRTLITSTIILVKSNRTTTITIITIQLITTLTISTVRSRSANSTWVCALLTGESIGICIGRRRTWRNTSPLYQTIKIVPSSTITTVIRSSRTRSTNGRITWITSPIPLIVSSGTISHTIILIQIIPTNTTLTSRRRTTSLTRTNTQLTILTVIIFIITRWTCYQTFII